MKKKSSLTTRYSNSAQEKHRALLQELEETKEKLKESKIIIQDTEELTGIGQWWWDVNSGEVKWSEAVYKIFGLNPKNFTPQIDSILKLSAPWPEDNQRAQELIQKATKERKKGYYEQRFLRPDKSTGHYYSTFRGKYNEKGELIELIGTVQDITLRKEMEISLRESREHLETTLHSIGDGVISTDNKGNISQMNPVAEQLCGWKLKDAQGKSVTEIFKIVNAKTRKRVPDPVKASLRKKDIVTLADHTVLIAKNKKEYKIADSVAPIKNKKGEIQGAVLVFSDVTEKYAIQEEIAKNAKRLSLAMDSFNIVVWDWDPLHNIANWSIRASKMFGMKIQNRSVVTSAEIFKTIHPDDLESLMEAIKNACNRDCEEGAKFRIIRPDGSIRVLYSRMSPIALEGHTKLVIVTTDITEENKLDQLKSNFVSVASHQLRTPLTAIRWFREMILDNAEKEPLTEKQSRHLMKIEESSSRMLELVDDLLQVSRLNNKSLELSPIKYDILETTKKLICQIESKSKEKKQKIELSCKLRKRTVWADRTLTEQVIQNLSLNAVKYSPNKSKIKIEITGGKKYIKWSITDQGIGIPEEDKSKVFQKFFRSKEASESKADGSGLGLYISKSIIELSGGELDFSSVHKKGSTFWFTLPRK